MVSLFLKTTQYMFTKPLGKHFLSLSIIFYSAGLPAQTTISLQEAVKTALDNYGTIKSKASYAAASKEAASFTRSEYLPNMNVAGQWTYGTVNGQIGPGYGFGGLGVASSGLPSPTQSWDAAFGAMYLANVNWDFFAFGRVKEKINTAEAIALRDRKDLEQETFEHSIRVTAAYLNLLTAQRLRLSYEKNLTRAKAVETVVTTRARTGLIAGVDSLLANAEVSNARIAITRARDFEQEQSNQLAVLMGIDPGEFVLDTLFIARLPALIEELSAGTVESHPTLQFYKSRILAGESQRRYYKTFYFPAFSLVGVLQTRASGFGSTYATDRTDFTHSPWEGFRPARSNFLLGLGVTWNVAQPIRYAHQVRSQELTNRALLEEYNLVSRRLNAQLELAGSKIRNALGNYREAPVQVKAAADAYLQKSVMYKNGLANLVELNQTLYALIRAETDRDIAGNSVWQSLLMKAAATGDYSLFESQL